MKRLTAYLALAFALIPLFPVTIHAQQQSTPTNIEQAEHPAAEPAPKQNQGGVDRERLWPRWVPWATVGVGVVITVVGGGLYWSAANNYDEYDAQIESQCGLAGCIGEELADISPQLDRARSQETAAKAAFIASGVVIATGAVFYYLDWRADKKYASSERVVVTPAVRSDAVGITARITF
ncbi:MAG: hypothetical protein Tsb0020_04250 [Haliangiales bacterium]